jgi:hypothetical protein
MLTMTQGCGCACPCVHTFNSWMPRVAIWIWRLCRPRPMAGLHLLHKSGALRRVPSPLQGTSHRMRSKVPGCLHTTYHTHGT